MWPGKAGIDVSKCSPLLFQIIACGRWSTVNKKGKRIIIKWVNWTSCVRRPNSSKTRLEWVEMCTTADEEAEPQITVHFWFSGCTESMCRCHAITGERCRLHFRKAGEMTPVWLQLLLFYRSQLISTPSGGSRCVQDERCGGIWLRSMPCTGAPIPGRRARTYMWRARGSVVTGKFLFGIPDFCLHRLLVSASQDGKLIIWDSYTTNKVGVVFCQINDHVMFTASTVDTFTAVKLQFELEERSRRHHCPHPHAVHALANST